jgi:hypothetical protein
MKWLAVILAMVFGLAVGFLIQKTIQPEPEFTFNQLLMLNDQTNSLINQQLSQVVAALPGVARVRLGLIHGPAVINKNNFRNYQFDVVNLKAAPGKDPGPTLSDQSMGQWQDFITPMLGGQCVEMQTGQLTSRETLERLNALRATTFYGCPVRNHRGDLIGGIFAIWDDATVPTDKNHIYAVLNDAAVNAYNAIETRLPRSDRL